MLGMGKKKKLEDLPEIPMPPKLQKGAQDVKTSTQEAQILQQDKTKLLEWLAAEYKEQYAGLFTEKDLEEIDQEATSLTLLFAIYGELRIIRMLKEKGLLAGLK